MVWRCSDPVRPYRSHQGDYENGTGLTYAVNYSQWAFTATNVKNADSGGIRNSSRKGNGASVPFWSVNFSLTRLAIKSIDRRTGVVIIHFTLPIALNEIFSSGLSLSWMGENGEQEFPVTRPVWQCLFQSMTRNRQTRNEWMRDSAA